MQFSAWSAPVMGSGKAAVRGMEAVDRAQQQQQPRVGAGVLRRQRRAQRVRAPRARLLTKPPPAYHPAFGVSSESSHWKGHSLFCNTLGQKLSTLTQQQRCFEWTRYHVSVKKLKAFALGYSLAVAEFLLTVASTKPSEWACTLTTDAPCLAHTAGTHRRLRAFLANKRTLARRS